MSLKINIGTYNTHLYMLVAKAYKEDERCDAIANWPYNRELDVMGFCEVWSDSAKERVCKNFNYHYFVDTAFWKMGSGLALASKYPIYEAEIIRFNKLVGEDAFSEKGFIRAVIHTPSSGDFRVYLTHAQANAIVDPSKIGLGPTSAEARKSNLEQIANDMKSYYPHLPAVVIGDLNVSGETEEYNSKLGVFSSMADAYRKALPDAGKYKGWTWDADTNLTVKVWDEDAKGGERLDYILYFKDSDWSVVSCDVKQGMKESDHYPLTAVLEMKTHTSYQVADTWEGAAGLAQKWKDQYGLGASTQIVITNETDEDIHLVKSHDWDGSFFSATPSILPAGKAAGLLHVHPSGLAKGSKGCIIMRQGGFDFFLGFSTHHAGGQKEVYVQCRPNGQWKTADLIEHMSHLIDKSEHASSNFWIGENNKLMKVKSGVNKDYPNPVSFFGITSKEDHRPIPTFDVSGGEFTYDGQPHPANAGKAIGEIKIPVINFKWKINPVRGSNSIIYQPGSDAAPKDAGVYKATVHFTSQDNRFQNASGETTIRINKANPNIVVNDGEVIFSESSHPVAASATGMAGKELPMSINYQGTTKTGEPYGPTDDPPTVAGEYQVTVSTTGDKNHNEGSKTVMLTIQPALAVVIAPEALEVRKGHSTHTNNIGHWLKHDEKIEVWDVWRGEDEVWVQHDNSGGRGPGWSAMEYKGKTFVEFLAKVGRE